MTEFTPADLAMVDQLLMQVRRQFHAIVNITRVVVETSDDRTAATMRMLGIIRKGPVSEDMFRVLLALALVELASQPSTADSEARS